MAGFSYAEHLFEKKWKDKRERIIKRDNGRCRLCGSTEGIVVHHMQYHVTKDGQKFLPWMYLDCYLITLCTKCHNKGHSQYEVPTFIVDAPMKSVFD